MAISSLFKEPALDNYINTNSSKLHPIALKLFDQAKNDEYSQMLSSPNQLQLLSIFMKMVGAKNILVRLLI